MEFEKVVFRTNPQLIELLKLRKNPKLEKYISQISQIIDVFGRDLCNAFSIQKLVLEVTEKMNKDSILEKFVQKHTSQ